MRSPDVEGGPSQGFRFLILNAKGRDMESINYELKYCERCGTLKLRQVASDVTYCRRCESLLGRFTFPCGGSEKKSAALAPSALRMPAGIPVVAVSDRLAGGVQ